MIGSGFAFLGKSPFARSLLLIALALISPSADLRAQAPDLVFPLFVSGESDGFHNSVRLILRNNDNAVSSGRILFRDSNGVQIGVSVQGEVVTEVDFELGPWSTFELKTDGSGPFQHGVVEVIAEAGDPSNLVGTEVFQLLGNLVSVPDAKAQASQQIYVSLNVNERTGVAVYNPSDSATAKLEFILLNEAGVEVAGRREMNLAPRGRISEFVDEEGFFKAFFASNPGPFKGTLNIHVREGPLISVLGLLQRSSDGSLIVVAPSPKAFDGAAAPGGSEGWAMAGANPERTSWTASGVSGNLRELWVRPIEPYVSQKAQVIGADGKVFVSTSRGLYAFAATDGSIAWIYPTELPLGHSATFAEGAVYVGGLDRRLYSIDAKTGELLWKFESLGGFQTNPVVVQGKVYLGSRDGFFYAVDAKTGKLAWRFETGGQILQSAAYKGGVLYFGCMDGHVYALSAENGALLWKSDKLPGLGWRSWWPVVHREKVILARTNEFRGGIYLQEDAWLFPPPKVELSVPGAWETAEGPWAPGTPTLNVASNPVGASIPGYFEKFPERRNLFVLDRHTGKEVPYDIDGNGIFDAAPILRAFQRAGAIYPPVVGFDGLLYLRTLSNESGAISGGLAVGWDPSLPYLTYPVSPHTGQSPDWPIDEPVGLSAAGNLLFWNLCCDRFIGAVDLSMPNVAFPNLDSTRQWRLVSGQGSTSIGPNSLPKGYDSQWLRYVWNPGDLRWMTQHGDNVGPAIYQGRLYVVRGNALIAFGAEGSGSSAPVLPPAATTPPPLSTFALPESAALKERLVQEVEKMIESGHLRPGFGVSGLFDPPAREILGDSLMDYWSNPGELHYILARCLPHLPPETQGRLRAYLQDEFKTFPPHQVLHIGWIDGVGREPFTIHEDAFGRLGPSGQRTGTSFPGWTFPPHNLYALWKYAEAGLGDPQNIFDLAKSRVVVPVPVSDVYLIGFPHVHNAYIGGYIGFLKIQQLAGEPPSAEVGAELERLLDLRVAHFQSDPVPNSGNELADRYFYTLITAWNFMYMVPELASHLRANSLNKVKAAIEKHERMAPYWFVTHNEEAQGENGVTPIYQSHTLFQAKAKILLDPPEVLYRYLDTPVFPVGDLYFIDNLVSLLEAESPS